MHVICLYEATLLFLVMLCFVSIRVFVKSVASNKQIFQPTIATRFSLHAKYPELLSSLLQSRGLKCKCNVCCETISTSRPNTASVVDDCDCAVSWVASPLIYSCAVVQKALFVVFVSISTDAIVSRFARDCAFVQYAKLRFAIFQRPSLSVSRASALSVLFSTTLMVYSVA